MRVVVPVVIVATAASGCAAVFMDRARSAPPAPPRCSTSRVLPVIDTAIALLGVALIGMTIASPTPAHGQLGNPDGGVVLGGAVLGFGHGVSAAQGFRWAARCRAERTARAAPPVAPPA